MRKNLIEEETIVEMMLIRKEVKIGGYVEIKAPQNDVVLLVEEEI